MNLQRTFTVIVASTGLLHLPAHAGTITIPWLVEFPTTITNPPPPRVVDVSTPDIAGAFRTTFGGIDAPGIDARAGLQIDATAETRSSALRFPVNISIKAPDRVRPGQLVNLDARLEPIDTASNPAFYDASGRATFDTTLNLSIQSDTFGVDEDITLDLPDQVEVDAVTLRFGGEEDFKADDTTARQVAGRVSFEDDPFGQSLRPVGTLTQGYQFEANDTIDGLEAAVDLVDLAAVAFPPIAPVAAIVDLDAGGGLDIGVFNTLTTNLGVAYYTYPGLDNEGFNFDQIDLTRNGAGTSVRVPDTLAPGDTFDLSFSALGLGFNVLTELALQGNFDLDLNLDVPLVDPSLELLSFDVGDPLVFDRQLTTFFYLQFLAEFMNPADAVLSMIVDGTAPDTPVAPGIPAGPAGADAALVQAIAQGALGDSTPAPFGEVYDAPDVPPLQLPVVSTTVIPLPPTALLLGAALAGAGLRRRVSARRRTTIDDASARALSRAEAGQGSAHMRIPAA